MEADAFRLDSSVDIVDEVVDNASLPVAMYEVLSNNPILAHEDGKSGASLAGVAFHRRFVIGLLSRPLLSGSRVGGAGGVGGGALGGVFGAGTYSLLSQFVEIFEAASAVKELFWRDTSELICSPWCRRAFAPDYIIIVLFFFILIVVGLLILLLYLANCRQRVSSSV